MEPKTPAAHYLTATLLCLSGIVLIAGENRPIGWTLLALTAASLFFGEKQFKKDALLLVIALGILGITPINTDTSIRHILLMGTTLIVAVLVPYLVSRFIYKDYAVRFHFRDGKLRPGVHIPYVLLAGAIAYFLLPFYLKSTGSYLNWPSSADPGSLIRLFIGTNSLGIWDELFFVITVLGLLRRYFRFEVANIFQATLFASFLYELGFRGWGFAMIFLFALLQGYIFKTTKSLLYVITIHLTVDLVLFLALIYAYHPEKVPLFFT